MEKHKQARRSLRSIIPTALKVHRVSQLMIVMNDGKDILIVSPFDRQRGQRPLREDLDHPPTVE